MNVHQPSLRASYARPQVKRKKSITIFGFSMREVFLILIITFPCLGTLFPLDSYLGVAGMGGFVSKTPFNTTVILTVILAYVLWLFAQNPQRSIVALRRNWPIFVFIMWAMVTSRWAETPGTSFNRSGRLLVFSLYAIYLVEFVPLRRMLQMMFVALTISCVVSLGTIVATPALSLTTDERGAWRGAMQHKNGLGVTVAIAFTTALICGYLKIYPLKFVAPTVLLSLLLLKLANSATAILAAAVVTSVLVIILFVVNRTRNPLGTLAFSVMGAAIVAGVVLSSGIVFAILGREGTLTGRADIWGFAWGMIAQNPFWGYGQGAWTFLWMKKLAYEELGWPIAHAHNAWIDFRFQLGIPGITLAILMWSLATINLLKLLARRQAQQIILPLAVFMLLSFRSYSETIIVDPALNDMFWFAFSVAAFAKGVNAMRHGELQSLARRRSRIGTAATQRI